jgi:TfoX/Sxy family transcriptional regulator of competence genes
MAYSEELARRIRGALADERAVTERKMFGGICFMIHGHMCCGVVDETLMLRVGAPEYESCLALPHAREMDFTGKPLRGYVYVAPAGVATPAALQRWLRRAVTYVGSLPPKPAAAKHR